MNGYLQPKSFRLLDSLDLLVEIDIRRELVERAGLASYLDSNLEQNSPRQLR